MAVVRANYLTPATAHRLGRAVAYYSWREDGERPRERPRTWYAHDGRRLDYAGARAEITGGAATAPYSYRLVLSTAAVPLSPEDYGAVLDRRFGRWYLVAHHGGAHPHAHAVAFADRRLGVSDLGALRAALAAHERERARGPESPVPEPGRGPRTREHPQELAPW